MLLEEKLHGTPEPHGLPDKKSHLLKSNNNVKSTISISLFKQRPPKDVINNNLITLACLEKIESPKSLNHIQTKKEAPHKMEWNDFVNRMSLNKSQTQQSKRVRQSTIEQPSCKLDGLILD